MSSALDDCGGWVKISSPAITKVTNDVAARILCLAAEHVGTPTFSDIEQLGEWILGQGANTPVVARKLRDAAKVDAEFKRCVNHCVIHELCCHLSGARLALFDVLRLRTVMSEHDFTRSRPHQDTALWASEPHRVNVWLALCDIDFEKAPLVIVAGSNQALLPHTQNEYGQLEVGRFEPDSAHLERILMSYGEVLIFDPSLVHFSAENKSSFIRWSVDFRYLEESVHETHG